MSKGLIKTSFKLAALLAIVCLVSGESKSITATQARDSSAPTVLGTLGSLVPGLITNVAPLVLLLGLGALMLPAFGMGTFAMGLLRQARRSSPDTQQFSPLQYTNQYVRPLTPSPSDFYFTTGRSFPSLSGINTATVMNGLGELFETVIKAIDNVDKNYN